MRTHAPIFDAEFLRLYDPDVIGGNVRKLMRLGAGKAYLCGGIDLDEFLINDELGRRWDEFFQNQFGLFDPSKDLKLFSDAEHFWTCSNIILSAGEELRNWARVVGLPVFDSVAELMSRSRKSSQFHEKWEKMNKASIVMGRNDALCTSWGDMLRNVADRKIPQLFNAAAVLDHHLFGLDDFTDMLFQEKPGPGLQNLLSIIQALNEGFKPQRLLVCVGVSFHREENRLRKFLEPSPDRYRGYSLTEEGMRELHVVMQRCLYEVGYKGDLELVGLTHKSSALHFREVMTNHHILKADKGFNAFGKKWLDQNECWLTCVLHDLMWEDDELDDEVVKIWRTNLSILRNVLIEDGHHCVDADGLSCASEDLCHPFILPIEEPESYHDS